MKANLICSHINSKIQYQYYSVVIRSAGLAIVANSVVLEHYYGNQCQHCCLKIKGQISLSRNQSFI